MVLITAKCICYVLLPGLLWEADKNRNIWHKAHICYPENNLTGLLGSDSHVPPEPQTKLHFADKMMITRPTDRPTGCVTQMDSRKVTAEPDGRPNSTNRKVHQLNLNCANWTLSCKIISKIRINNVYSETNMCTSIFRAFRSPVPIPGQPKWHLWGVPFGLTVTLYRSVLQLHCTTRL